MARPTRLTRAVFKRIVRAVQVGNTRKTAAHAAGVGEATVYAWLARGRAAKSGVYREFSEAIEAAEAVAIQTSVGLVRRAAQRNWQAAAWWLERRYPDEWGRKDRVEISETLRREARRLADEMGLDVDEVVADAERYLASIR